MPALDLNFAANRSLPADYGPTPSYSRASTGTLFNSSGVLASAAVNVPRFDHVYSGGSWVSRGLLVEEQRTNLYLYSEDLSQGNTANNVTVSTNTDMSPDGNTTADKITSATSTAIHYLEKGGYAVSSSTAYTISLFAKKGTHRYIQISANNEGSGVYANFDIQAGILGNVGASATGSITNCANGWFRCSMTYTATNISSRPLIVMVSGTTAARVESTALTTSDTVLIWGVQQEAGSFATSYIPTTSSSATRSADVCQITGTSFSSFFNANEGSIAAEYDTIYPLSLASSRRLFIFRDAGNSVRLNSEINTPGLYWETVPAGANILGAYSASAYDVVKAGYGYKVNDFAITVNGATASTDTSVSVPTGITLLDIGGMNGSQYLCGHISRLRYYPTRLTNATLQSLST
jgi:hypothetical protein